MAEMLNKSYYAFGTINNFNIEDTNSEEIMDKIVKIIYNLDSSMSYFSKDSQIYNINNNSKSWVNVNEEIIKIIQLSKKYNKISKGYFNIAIRPLINLWNKAIPNKKEINKALKLIKNDYILIDERNKRVQLKLNGMEIDLGGIAKGYAASIIKYLLEEDKVKNAVIDFGGQILIHGENKVNVGIQSPNKDRFEILGTVNLENTNAVTSGNYERYSVVDGKKINHIFNPKTGKSVDSSVQSVTIISEDAVFCEVFAKWIMMLNIDEIKRLVKKSRIECVVVFVDKKILLTKNIENKFKLLDHEYIVEVI